MKIGIFAFPRTTSTLLGYSISKWTNEPFFQEPLTDRPIAADKYKYIHTHLNPAKSGIFKFMNHNFTEIDWQSINWKNFDKLIFVERRNITMACISCYVALTNNKWQYWAGKPHRGVVCGEIQHHFVNNFISQLKIYFDIKKELEKISDGITIFYEDVNVYSATVAAYIGVPKFECSGPIEASGLDYSSLCTNYKQVSKWVDDLCPNNLEI